MKDNPGDSEEGCFERAGPAKPFYRNQIWYARSEPCSLLTLKLGGWSMALGSGSLQVKLYQMLL